ncbi:MAG TPA: beta-propeller domain-containing protein [Candidatus Pacearchaeota archaeon]|nr:beta-propeller domain-containing protein [Candidatus Parcubacteria bacterium]HOU46110.1 beta-propeller domain-containing protein [Candidatus Pacearchaeota archaeon]HPM08651.1 beta-propeller domain-containing protein [Candidatus Pacearchaeota archaeon]HQI74670.1 beta-propeller domain-containing protein [Candidatus Pacearchaeota archaeon]
MAKEPSLSRQIIFSVIIGLSLIAMFFIASNYDKLDKITMPKFNEPKSEQKKEEQKTEVNNNIAMKKFSSDSEFREFVENNQISSGGIGGGARSFNVEETMAVNDSAAPVPMLKKEADSQAVRYSQTNTQVLSIDEPDIVKTDGSNIYLSEQGWGGWIMPMEDSAASDVMTLKVVPGFAPDYQNYSKTRIISAFPVQGLGKISELKKAGNILLSKDRLIIFSQDGIYGYDIKDKKNPVQAWKIEYKSSNYLAGARLYNGKIYLITRSGINISNPCPIKPLAYNGQDLLIKCTDIYYPIEPSYTDSTFTGMIVNPETGSVEKTISFVGSSNDSIIYMSENSLYATYQINVNNLKFFAKFFSEKCGDLIPGDLIVKLNKVDGYDISQKAKNVEFETIWSNYIQNLDPDQRLKMENELTNRFSDYRKDHLREMEQTAIVKIDLKDFDIKAQGKISGSPLNQFSLDEYQGNLRVATTIGQRWFDIYLQGLNFSNNYTANDVYVLDSNLAVSGVIKDLGLEERIYSARFIGDKGYLVTFKQVDPFFVLDLKDPKNPKMAGQLKIPGYSGYLHPLRDNIILGVGKEDQNVKLSLFDVSDPSNPQEKDKYTLKEYYTNILNDHHGFLADKEKEVFFLPGSQGAYLFSYKGDKLELKKAVDKIYAQRAVYIDKYFYIIGNDKIIIINQDSWTRVTELELKD